MAPLLALSAIGAGAESAGAAGSSASSAAAPLPALHVEGKWIRDASGHAVTLRGVSVADLDAIHNGDRDQSGPTTVFDIIDRGCSSGWDIDVFRLPVHPEVTDETGSHGWLHYAPQDYFERILDPAVQHAIRRGKYVIVDWHYIGADWRDPAVESSTEAFWLGKGAWPGVAVRYANHPNVLFELFNEPGAGSWSDWKVTAQRWVAGIRARGAGNLVIVGGPVWSQVMPQRASDLLNGPNIVYACHVYPAHVHGAMPPWIDFVSGVAPVMMTEWGFEKDGPMPVNGTASSYGRTFRAYIDAHPNVGWTAWCFDSVYRPMMFDTAWVLLGNGKSTHASRFGGGAEDTSENYMGQFVKNWLSEARAKRAGTPGP